MLTTLAGAALSFGLTFVQIGIDFSKFAAATAATCLGVPVSSEVRNARRLNAASLVLTGYRIGTTKSHPVMETMATFPAFGAGKLN